MSVVDVSVVEVFCCDGVVLICGLFDDV